jgi:hypothetical protein
MYIIPTFYTIKLKIVDVVIEWNKKQEMHFGEKKLTSLNLMDKLTYMTL